MADFFFEKDPLFAELTLSAADYALYLQLFTRLAWSAPKPDVVVYLHAPVDVLVERVRKRGRDSEHGLQAEYLAQVSARYRAFFADYQHPHLITVDAESYDLVADEAAFAWRTWGSAYARLVVSFSNSADERSQIMTSQHYDPIASRSIAAMRTVMPELDMAAAVRAYLFSISVALSVMARTGRAARLSQGRCDDSDTEEIVGATVAFSCAGIRALAKQAVNQFDEKVE